MEGYGSSSSSQPTARRPFAMKNGQQEVQPSIPLGKTWGKLPEDMSQSDRPQRPYGESSHYPSYRRTTDPDREYSDSSRLTRGRPNQPSSGLTPFRNQQISGQESEFLTIPGGFQKKKGIQRQKQDLFQPKAERVTPNVPEAVGLGERSTQDPEIVVHTSRISSPINRNITPTHIEHNVDTPESNLNNDALWLQMSQFAEQTQKKLAELH
ncbi:hypothetical protein O181_004949 [Austropuccinia psidii MF-1]|uniref:Uncharacterized protein n=1 Tax=Austropuccinia psidii MF-1 TaxID=1389203 RepID=A0A9Q3GFE3_9BASI|nr:hypothetical protein [Austropuccinia psidii MF-1]